MAFIGEVLLLEQGTAGVTPSLQTVTGVGAIGSAESFGVYYGSAIYGSAVYGGSALHVARVAKPTGVVSAQAFGRPTLNISKTPNLQTVTGVGAIPSGQAFGTPTKSPQIIRGQGIASVQAVGTPNLIGAGAFPALFGHCLLGDTPAFAATTDDAAPFAAATGDINVYTGVLDDALLYQEQLADTLVYAATEDDTQ